MQTSLEILYSFARLLDELGIRYVVVGSLASSARGEPRSTIDADVVAEITREHSAVIAKRLAAEFYADEKAIRLAALTRTNFNAIHFETAFKIDVYVAGSSPFDQQQLLRRLPEVILPNSSEPVFIATAEDTLVAKLLWFRKGDELSNKQWKDVLGILAVQGAQLDFDYVRKWAGILKVSDLLEKAIKETR